MYAFYFCREEAQKLRKYRGGLLKTTKAGSGNGELLPRDKEKENGSGCPGGRTDRCFLAGKFSWNKTKKSFSLISCAINRFQGRHGR